MALQEEVEVGAGLVRRFLRTTVTGPPTSKLGLENRLVYNDMSGSYRFGSWIVEVMTFPTALRALAESWEAWVAVCVAARIASH